MDPACSVGVVVQGSQKVRDLVSCSISIKYRSYSADLRKLHNESDGISFALASTVPLPVHRSLDSLSSVRERSQRPHNWCKQGRRLVKSARFVRSAVNIQRTFLSLG